MRRVFLITAVAAIVLLSAVTQFVNAKPRLAADASGDLDPTFGSGGLSYADIGTASGDKAYAIVEQSDGNIIVAGTTDESGRDAFAIIRLTDLGALDNTFDGDGKVTTSISTTLTINDVAYGVAVQTDNKIVVVGSTGNGVNDNFALVRYTIAGALDTTFGGDGIVETSITDGVDIARAIIIQGDGRILVAGTAGGDFAVARYTDSGVLDDTFSGDGIVTTDFFGSSDEGHAIAVDRVNGDIVVAGFADIGHSDEFAVARYDSFGTLDSSFDGDGKVTTDFQNNSVDHAFGVALQADGKIVLAGFVNSDAGGTDDFALARYNINGSLDSTFSDDGKVVTPVGSADDQAYSVKIQPTGKIVVAGFVDTKGVTKQDFAVARYTTGGALDTTFGGGDGIVLTDLGTINSENERADEAYAMTLQADNKILLAGLSDYPSGNDNFAVTRYLSPNSPPIVSNINKDGLEDIETFFSEVDFSASFSDADLDEPVKIKIGSLPVTGTLKLDGIPVSIDQEIPAFEFSNLSFTSPSEWNGNTDFDWNGSDGLDYAASGASVILNNNVLILNALILSFSDQALDEDAGLQSIPTWATGMSAGPANEIDQQLSFVVETDNDALFAALPAIDAETGDLSFTTAVNKNGAAVVTVTLIDDGGTLNGGVDSSPPQNFNITINPVNDAPSFTAGLYQKLDEDAGPQSVSGWATSISPGPIDEAGQTLNFTVETDNDPLFSTLPAIDPTTGDLLYTTAENQHGATTITVTLMDDGGTQNGGIDTSATQNFSITVDPVNDLPVISSFAKHGLMDNDMTFQTSNFEDQFNDVDGDLLVSVKVITLPAHGMLALSGLPVAAGQNIMATNVDNLTFTPQAGWTGESEFLWNGNDGLAYAVADADVTLSVTEMGHIILFLPLIIGGS